MRSGQLTRALLGAARADPQRAFAWGWLTHVLADQALHPVVNQVAAESLGWEAPRMERPEQIAAHVAVEMGLDAHYVGRYPFLRDIRLRPVLDPRSTGFVRDALHDTYGIEFDGEALLRSHRAVLRFHRPVLLVGRHTTVRWGGHLPDTWLLWVLAPLMVVLRSVPAFPPTTSAFLDPMPPSDTLRHRVDGVIRRFPEMVHHHQVTRLATLPDFDLETGAIEDPTRPTPSTLRLLEELAERGLQVAGHPATGEAA
jgi:hypothetical protein